MLADKDPATGEYRIPKFIYADAFYSETVAYADLVLPDTTYLERWDCISLLDRPIGTAHGPGDAIRQPVVAPDRDVRPFQDVLIDLGARLELPAFAYPDGEPRYPGGYPDYLVHHQRKPGIGPLAGWRGAEGRRARPRRAQRPTSSTPTSRTAASGSSSCRPRRAISSPSTAPISPAARELGLRRHRDADHAAPLCRDPAALPAGRRGARRGPAAGRATASASAATSTRCRSGTSRSSRRRSPSGDYPLHAITQRPMPMYHSWGSQNAWLRQILARNFLYMNRAHRRGAGPRRRRLGRGRPARMAAPRRSSG